MAAPIIYKAEFLPRYPGLVENSPQASADIAFTRLRDELEWEHRDAPRQEYYCNDVPKAYMYGRGVGQRLYEPRPYHHVILAIRAQIELLTGSVFEVCFLNRYLNSRNQLGWHADDSPEMDDGRPIAIVSLGAEREIWFRPIQSVVCAGCGQEKGHKMDCQERRATKTRYGEVEKIKLGHGSLCLMGPGMQDAWQHRIPKASFECGERISLTFRGYVEP